MSDYFAQETAWIAAHREEYAGKWVALLGDQLIASGDTSEDVFARARAAATQYPPLVTRIERATLPFGGW